MRNADVAQLVAHHLAKVRVAGSNPVIRSRGRARRIVCLPPFARWSGRVVRQRPAKPCTRVRFPSPPRAISSAGERFPDTEEVTGSIPVSRTTATVQRHFSKRLEECLFCFFGSDGESIRSVASPISRSTVSVGISRILLDLCLSSHGFGPHDRRHQHDQRQPGRHHESQRDQRPALVIDHRAKDNRGSTVSTSATSMTLFNSSGPR